MHVLRSYPTVSVAVLCVTSTTWVWTYTPHQRARASARCAEATPHHLVLCKGCETLNVVVFPGGPVEFVFLANRTRSNC